MRERERERKPLRAENVGVGQQAQSQWPSAKHPRWPGARINSRARSAHPAPDAVFRIWVAYCLMWTPPSLCSPLLPLSRLSRVTLVRPLSRCHCCPRQADYRAPRGPRRVRPIRCEDARHHCSRHTDGSIHAPTPPRLLHHHSAVRATVPQRHPQRIYAFHPRSHITGSFPPVCCSYYAAHYIRRK